jgi:hypothetical protein
MTHSLRAKFNNSPLERGKKQRWARQSRIQKERGTVSQYEIELKRGVECTADRWGQAHITGAPRCSRAHWLAGWKDRWMDGWGEWMDAVPQRLETNLIKNPERKLYMASANALVLPSTLCFKPLTTASAGSLPTGLGLGLASKVPWQ